MANFLGTNGNDVLFSTTGNDNVNGGAGNDNIIASTGSDIYQGGTGYDTVFYTNLSQPITLKAFGEVIKQGGLHKDSLRDVEKVVATNAIGDTIDASEAGFPSSGISIDLEAGRVNVLGLSLGFDIGGFENIIGSNLSDSIRGNASPNLIAANAGNDFIFASDGDDTINAGLGNDTISGGNQVDIITGGSGDDVVRLTVRASFDRITDFSASAPGNNDTIALVDGLDNGFGSETVAGGIRGLNFEGSFDGARLASSSFFKGAGVSGANLGQIGGIYVNTLNGEVRYNEGPTAGSSLIAVLTPSAASALTTSDFVFTAFV